MIKVWCKCLLAVLLISCVLTGCGAVPGAETVEKKQYQATFLDLFNTVTTIVGKAESEEEFRARAQEIYDELLENMLRDRGQHH